MSKVKERPRGASVICQSCDYPCRDIAVPRYTARQPLRRNRRGDLSGYRFAASHAEPRHPLAVAGNVIPHSVTGPTR